MWHRYISATVAFGGNLVDVADHLAAAHSASVDRERSRACAWASYSESRTLSPGSPVFDVPANPTEAASRAALAVYQAHRCDGICAVGGGSPIDLAKCVALLAGHSGPLESYAAIYGGISRITGTIAPVVAIPTTAGTGSEVGRAALITLDDGRKLGFISPHLIPRRAVCDPELTIGLPPFLTAATGLDALSHCSNVSLASLHPRPKRSRSMARPHWRNIDAAVEWRRLRRGRKYDRARWKVG